MRRLSAAALVAALCGCAASGPLPEADRARVHVVLPVGARFAPEVDFEIPPGTAVGAATAVAGGAAGTAYVCAAVGWAFVPACFVAVAPWVLAATTPVGAATYPSNKGLAPIIERARSHLGAADVQQLLMQRFSERVQRQTPYRIDPEASALGPQARKEAPNYPRTAADGAVVAEVAVKSVRGTLFEPFKPFFGGAYASRPLRIVLEGRLRVVRAADGQTLLRRDYLVGRYARPIGAYQDDAAPLFSAIAGLVDELATQMVDDAFLLRTDAQGEALAMLAPLPRSTCLAAGFDCWAFLSVPRLETASPAFRWSPLVPTAGMRNVVYDLWIFGGDDDRLVEGLAATEHALDRPLSFCTRYSWAVRARFDTDAGPRALEWSSATKIRGSKNFSPDMRPTFGAPFITPCPK